jgi:hypothetical protein
MVETCVLVNGRTSAANLLGYGAQEWAGLRILMRVSDRQRVLFVHVPKTGGSTVDAMFDRRIDDCRNVTGLGRHATYERLLDAEPGLAEYWSFGFVRNPWARMVSWWSMVAAVFENADKGVEQARRKIEKYPNAWLPEGEFRYDFDRFVLEGTEKVAKLGRPQSLTLARADGTLVSFVGRLENFDRDLNVVREKLGLRPRKTQPRRNKSSHGHYCDYYNDKTRARVAQVFARDIELFGYTY